MAIGYDGSIRINTKLDSKGFLSGINSMGSALKKLGTVIAAVFSVQAIVNFGKEAVNAASELSNAWTGLQSIVEGQGRSFETAKSFIEDYISDGLIPLQDAVTAYKNLAARGYDDEQIKQTLTSLKDAAAFGRQASYSMGDAVKSATEGLKNENSVLVDNAGVTKNVAKMWEDYAKSIGVSVNDLTQQQKIQAEVNGILEETKFQAGDAAKASNTYSGQVSALTANFQNLKVAIGQGIIPIVQAVLPSINLVITKLTELAKLFAQVSKLIFGGGLSSQAGTQNEIAKSGNAAAQATDKLAAATTAAGKSAKQAEKDMKGVLAGFDEISTLRENTGTASVGLELENETIDLSEIQTTGEVFSDIEISPKALKIVESFKAFIEDSFREIDLTHIKESFSGLVEALRPLTENIGSGLKWLWDNVLVPFGTWTMNSLVPKFIDVLAVALDGINRVIDFLKPGFTWLWENFFRPLASWTGGLVIDILDALIGVLKTLFGWITGDTELAMEGLQNLQDAFIRIWERIKSLLSAVGGFFKRYVIDPIANSFKSFINGLLSGVEGFVNFFIKGINFIIGAFNKLSFNVPEWVPGIGGKSFGINIQPVKEISLPRLANGAVIPPNQQFAAILGDQRSGMNIEAPASLIKQMVSEAMREYGGSGEFNITVVTQLDGKEVARNQVKHINNMTREAGKPVLLY